MAQYEKSTALKFSFPFVFISLPKYELEDAQTVSEEWTWWNRCMGWVWMNVMKPMYVMYDCQAMLGSGFVQNILKMEGGGPGKFVSLWGDPFMAQRYCVTRRIPDSSPILAWLRIPVFPLPPGPSWSWSTHTNSNDSRSSRLAPTLRRGLNLRRHSDVEKAKVACKSTFNVYFLVKAG